MSFFYCHNNYEISVVSKSGHAILKISNFQPEVSISTILLDKPGGYVFLMQLILISLVGSVNLDPNIICLPSLSLRQELQKIIFLFWQEFFSVQQ